MGLFKSDLYRSFAVGFAFGALIVGMQVGPRVLEEIVPQAHAQTVVSQEIR